MIPAETVREFVERSNQVVNDTVIVIDEDGDYSVIPDAYLSDVSYSGSTEVVQRGGREFAARILREYSVDNLSTLSGEDWESITAFVNESE